jgi:hypothetical protein
LLASHANKRVLIEELQSVGSQLIVRKKPKPSPMSLVVTNPTTDNGDDATDGIGDRASKTTGSVPI